MPESTCTISYHVPGCHCFGPLETAPKKTWTGSDVRKALDGALDGIASEFYGVGEFRRMDRKEKIKLLREVKADVATMFAYEWMMRGV